MKYFATLGINRKASSLRKKSHVFLEGGLLFWTCLPYHSKKHIHSLSWLYWRYKASVKLNQELVMLTITTLPVDILWSRDVNMNNSPNVPFHQNHFVYLSNCVTQNATMVQTKRKNECWVKMKRLWSRPIRSQNRSTQNKVLYNTSSIVDQESVTETIEYESQTNTDADVQQVKYARM